MRHGREPRPPLSHKLVEEIEGQLRDGTFDIVLFSRLVEERAKNKKHEIPRLAIVIDHGISHRKGPYYFSSDQLIGYLVIYGKRLVAFEAAPEFEELAVCNGFLCCDTRGNETVARVCHPYAATAWELEIRNDSSRRDVGGCVLLRRRETKEIKRWFFSPATALEIRNIAATEAPDLRIGGRRRAKLHPPVHKPHRRRSP